MLPNIKKYLTLSYGCQMSERDAETFSLIAATGLCEDVRT
jgi:hypothetical protein